MQLRDDSPSRRFDWPRRLRTALRVQRLSMSEVGRRAGATPSMVAALANGKREGTARVQGKIADALGHAAFAVFPRNASEAALADDWLAAWEATIASREAQP
jgi:transcriptional regulator with XRE-family HTH domain